VLGLEVIYGQLLPPEVFVANSASPESARQLGDRKRTTQAADFVGLRYFGGVLSREISISCNGDVPVRNGDCSFEIWD